MSWILMTLNGTELACGRYWRPLGVSEPNTMLGSLVRGESRLTGATGSSAIVRLETYGEGCHCSFHVEESLKIYYKA